MSPPEELTGWTQPYGCVLDTYLVWGDKGKLQKTVHVATGSEVKSLKSTFFRETYTKTASKGRDNKGHCQTGCVL